MVDKCIVDGVEEKYHDGIVSEWGFNDKHDWTSVEYKCRRCGATNPTDFPLKYRETMEVHNATCDGTCGMCKSKKILWSTGDASRDISAKKWDGELAAYRDARSQGIQPAGTTRAHVEQAYKASEALGKAYDADSMPKAKDINKNTVEVMKEIGQI